MAIQRSSSAARITFHIFIDYYYLAFRCSLIPLFISLSPLYTPTYHFYVSPPLRLFRLITFIKNVLKNFFFYRNLIKNENYGNGKYIMSLFRTKVFPFLFFSLVNFLGKGNQENIFLIRRKK